MIINIKDIQEFLEKKDFIWDGTVFDGRDKIPVTAQIFGDIPIRIIGTSKNNNQYKQMYICITEYEFCYLNYSNKRLSEETTQDVSYEWQKQLIEKYGENYAKGLQEFNSDKKLLLEKKKREQDEEYNRKQSTLKEEFNQLKKSEKLVIDCLINQPEF